MKEVILTHLKNKDMESLKSLLSVAEELEILDVFYDLTSEEQVLVFRLLSKDRALSVFEELDTDEQQILLRSFTDEGAIEFVNEMAPDDRVKLLDELPASVAKKLINALSPEEREVTNTLMGYKPETAGRIMTTEFISLKRDMTVEQALEKVSAQAEDKETIYTLFVTDSAQKLEGILTLKGLLIARGVSGKTISGTDGNTLVGSIMSQNAISVTTDTDQEEVANILKELDLLAIPVVDKEGRMVGIVTIDDAVDILEEEATEDIYDAAGLADITGNEADRSEVLVRGKLSKIWMVRMPFLIITLIAGMFAAGIISGFEEALESVVAIAFFIPLIMDMGGTVGTQSSTVFARGVVLGHIDIKSFGKHFVKEIGIGFSMGVLIGAVTWTIIAIIATFFSHVVVFTGITIQLAFAVALSLVSAMTLAALLGFLVPFVLIKLNVDQAAGSAPIITSIKDIAGLLIYFMFVSAFMGHLL